MDSYNFGVDSSSDEENKSSDDDIDDFDNGDEAELSDDFEKEMENELNNEFLKHRQQHFHNIAQMNTGKQVSLPNEEPESDNKNKGKDNNTLKDNTVKKVYEDDYFSSGSDDEDKIGGVKTKSKERREVQTDDELLYDPNMDTDDEQWMTKQRGHQSKNGSTQNYGKAVNSDAILSCPACLTTLCIDCQRHDTYKTQFRAMFVMNCTILSQETLRYEAKNANKKTKKKQATPNPTTTTTTTSPSGNNDELFNPVQCSLCNTEVAVFDKDEVYHFFNVVESLS